LCPPVQKEFLKKNKVTEVEHMNDSLFLSERYPDSGRTATFEDNGTSAWLYFSEPGSAKVVANAWVFNRVTAPKKSEIASYRGGPPPAAEGFAGPKALCKDPFKYKWSLQWSDDGESCAVVQGGQAIAMITNGQRPGYSRHLTQKGPWGEPWNEVLYRSLMDQDG
jgi:hypothetical protein